jgi:2-polyprenyl-3-methyl-5-hydroxy-6-metoxy-1,4-benzoquinol methylase
MTLQVPAPIAHTRALKTIAQPRCMACGGAGPLRHAAIPDLLLGLPDRWQLRQCDACTSLWLDPCPAADELAKAYENYVTHDAGAPLARPPGTMTRIRAALQSQALGYPGSASLLDRVAARLLRLWAPRREYALRELLYTPYRPAGALLEIGCGNGRQLERFRQAGWDVTGLDFDEGAVRTARALGLEVHQGDLFSQSFEGGRFDAIVMSHVIEHVPQPAALLRECWRILKPGGVMIVVTPNAKALGHRVYGRHWLGLDPPRHLAVYSADGLRQLVTTAGLQVTTLRTAWVVAPSWFLATLWRRRAEAEGIHVGLPKAGERPPLPTLLLVALEALGCELGVGWGEELVLLARRAPAQGTRG